MASTIIHVILWKTELFNSIFKIRRFLERLEQKKDILKIGKMYTKKIRIALEYLCQFFDFVERFFPSN